MTRDEMIEKAARAMYEGDWEREPGPDTQAAYRFMAEAALSAVCPGLLAGTHWEAPMEATGRMAAAAWWNIAPETVSSMNAVYAAMRDAYLAETKK
jgi:hypothetical protein